MGGRLVGAVVRAAEQVPQKRRDACGCVQTVACDPARMAGATGRACGADTGWRTGGRRGARRRRAVVRADGTGFAGGEGGMSDGGGVGSVPGWS